MLAGKWESGSGASGDDADDHDNEQGILYVGAGILHRLIAPVIARTLTCSIPFIQMMIVSRTAATGAVAMGVVTGAVSGATKGDRSGERSLAKNERSFDYFSAISTNTIIERNFSTNRDVLLHLYHHSHISGRINHNFAAAFFVKS